MSMKKVQTIMLNYYKLWPKSVVLGQIISTPQLYKFYSLSANHTRLQESLSNEGIIPDLDIDFMFAKITEVNLNTETNSSKSNKLF